MSEAPKDIIEAGIVETIARMIAADQIGRAFPDEPLGVQAKLVDADWRTHDGLARQLLARSNQHWQAKEAARKRREAADRERRRREAA